MHVIASTADGVTLTLGELERLAEQELAVEREELAERAAGRSRRSLNVT
jgi:hypothetical protein